MDFKTADLCDEHAEHLQIAEPLFQNFGGKTSFHGVISTLKVMHDYALFRSTLESPGAGSVLVVDGGGSTKRALMGDKMAHLAIQNGWAGMIVFGAIRDSEELAQLNVGVKALTTCPIRGDSKGLGHSDILVRFAGVTFTPGHYLYADSDGIIVATKPLHVK